MDQNIVQGIMDELVKTGAIVSGVNKVVPMDGERLTISLEGRDIDIAYYKTETPNRPLILGFHGGGFVIGGSAIDNHLWVKLRDVLDVNVASVDYRMAPDHKWPAAVQDAYDSAVYFKERAEEFGIDPEKIIAMGSSAGGNIAATACIYAKQQGSDIFKGQVLFYPYLDLVTDPAEKNGEGLFSGPALAAMNALYADEENYSKSTLSPVCATEEELKDLPPAIFCLAGADAICREAVTYSEMLKAAGVPVCVKVFEGMPHAFIENWYADQIPDMMLDEVTKKTLEDGSLEVANKEVMEFVSENFRF